MTSKSPEGRPTVHGDSAYGSGEFQGLLQRSRVNSRCRTQPARAPGGRFAKDRLDVDLARGTVTRADGDSSDTARSGRACAGCELRDLCTGAAGGRSVRVGGHEAALARQQDPRWRADCRAVRPKAEREFAHLMRRRHGGRRARRRPTPPETPTPPRPRPPPEPPWSRHPTTPPTPPIWHQPPSAA
ncbi:MAG: hypothetical protein OXJ37_01720 [Bryobacterales bacterium]|nr:hypothetical protein [Bryobacterales bacterium]